MSTFKNKCELWSFKFIILNHGTVLITEQGYIMLKWIIIFVFFFFAEQGDIIFCTLCLTR